MKRQIGLVILGLIVTCSTALAQGRGGGGGGGGQGGCQQGGSQMGGAMSQQGGFGMSQGGYGGNQMGNPFGNQLGSVMQQQQANYAAQLQYYAMKKEQRRAERQVVRDRLLAENLKKKEAQEAAKKNKLAGGPNTK